MWEQIESDLRFKVSRCIGSICIEVNKEFRWVSFFYSHEQEDVIGLHAIRSRGGGREELGGRVVKHMQGESLRFSSPMKLVHVQRWYVEVESQEMIVLLSKHMTLEQVQSDLRFMVSRCIGSICGGINKEFQWVSFW